MTGSRLIIHQKRASLKIRGRQVGLMPHLPHLIFIDGHYAAVMQGDNIGFELPAGRYDVRVQCGGRLPLRLLSKITHADKSVDLSVSASAAVVTGPRPTFLVFHDRDRIWNILFDIDLVAWIVSLFVTFSPIYKILSDSFFAIWLLRLFIIRKRYYKISVTQEPPAVS